MIRLPFEVCPVSTPRHPGHALAALTTLAKLPGTPGGGCAKAAVTHDDQNNVRATDPTITSSQSLRIFMTRPPSTLQDPSVLGETRPRPLFQIGRSQLRHVVGRYRVARRVRIDSVDARGVEAEDLSLHVRRERAVPEPLHQRLWHRESAKHLDLPLPRAPPDGVGAPEHVIGAERLEEHA